MGPFPTNADAVLATNKHTAAVVDVLAHERMAGFFLPSLLTEPFRRIILTNADVVEVEYRVCARCTRGIVLVGHCRVKAVMTMKMNEICLN